MDNASFPPRGKSIICLKSCSTPPLFRKNCLNFVKLLAAFQVAAGHLTQHLEPPMGELAQRYLYFFRGVPVFFAVSGFLIWFSIARSASCGQYLVKRFKRIYPELWLAVAIELLVLVSSYRDWNAKDLLLFALGQGSVFQFWTPASLRGYGVGTPNGTLWTICVTIQFYLAAWPFYRLMHGKRMRAWVSGWFVSCGGSIVFQWVFESALGRETLTKLYGQTLIRYFWLFYVGMFVAEWYERVLPLCVKYAWVFLLAAMCFFHTSADIYAGYYVFWSLFLILGALGFAYRFPQIQIKTDISYGLFLYQMTVVNFFVSHGWTGTWSVTIAAAVLSLLAALASTLLAGRALR